MGGDSAAMQRDEGMKYWAGRRGTIQFPKVQLGREKRWGNALLSEFFLGQESLNSPRTVDFSYRTVVLPASKSRRVICKSARLCAAYSLKATTNLEALLNLGSMPYLMYLGVPKRAKSLAGKMHLTLPVLRSLIQIEALETDGRTEREDKRKLLLIASVLSILLDKVDRQDGIITAATDPDIFGAATVYSWSDARKREDRTWKQLDRARHFVR
jgi:hypothetical protein